MFSRLGYCSLLTSQPQDESNSLGLRYLPVAAPVHWETILLTGGREMRENESLKI